MKKILILGLALLGLTSCSRLDIAFRWMDVFIAGKVDDYFDINSQQKKELKKSVNQDLKLIQAKLLPQWIEQFKLIQNDVNLDSFDEKKVARYFTSFMTDVDEMKTYFLGTAVKFAASIDDSQMIYFQKSFLKKTAEDVAKAKDQTELRKKYQEKYVDYFEMFVGSLTQEQERLVTKHLASSCFPAELKAKNNEHIFTTFVAEAKNREARVLFVKDLYSHPQQYDLPAYRDAVATYQSDLKGLITEVLMTLTPDQKKKLKKNLAEKTAQLEKVQASIL
ncbi:hypothetical protein D3C87_1211370 [compost metagenome]